MKRRRRDVLIAVLHPGSVSAATERGLRELEKAGWLVERFQSGPNIDRSRSVIASHACRRGVGRLVWIDSDMLFGLSELQRLLDWDREVVSGLCARKATPVRAVGDGWDGPLRPMHGLVRARYIGCGFIAIRTSLLQRLQGMLPICEDEHGVEFHPYYLPMTVANGQAHRYLSEDYAFCERVSEIGGTLWCDTTLPIGHMGAYAFTF